MNRVLMVAYHFPPLAGSSGIQRTLRFVQKLPDNGWMPLVLTTRESAYERTGDDPANEVPTDTVVRRAFALDTARHLSIRGRHIASMARPDRWSSWRFDGVRQGMRLVREFKPKALWSTYPIATAHVIGAELHRRTGLPWIADFRDPMAQNGYPADSKTWKRYKAIEEHAMQHANCCVFTTPGAARSYRLRYPEAAERITVIENGYDEESFAGVETANDGPLNPGAITLLHSGIVYPDERDPSHLFGALRKLKQSCLLTPGRLKLRFRAAVHEDMLTRMATEHGVAEYIELCPPVGYREALAEMMRADALLVLQASNCNEQVPAKVYEYLRAGRPILCLSDPAGDTAATLLRSGVEAIARLDSTAEIANIVPPFLMAVANGHVKSPTTEAVRAASRKARAEALARRLDRLVDTKSQTLTDSPIRTAA